jgi:hypothetical protein
VGVARGAKSSLLATVVFLATAIAVTNLLGAAIG